MPIVFFYGLFMDESLLIEKGLKPEKIETASVTGYRLQIGDRATLVRSPDSTSYGVLMKLTDQEVEQLYSAPSVVDYRPEILTAVTESGDEIQAACYNLPAGMAAVGANPGYARKLRVLAESLGFPAEYVEEVRALEAPTA